jgi:tRNA(fMet)-specific endonuclease VapC
VLGTLGRVYRDIRSKLIRLRDGEHSTIDRPEGLGGDFAISAITRVELEGGVYRIPSYSSARRLQTNALLATIEVIAFGDAAAAAYGLVISTIGFSRSRINDRIIAAQALIADATLVTTNGDDFRDIPGLKLDVWPAV